MTTLDAVCCARLPATALPALAVLRCRVGIQAIVEGAQVWLRWSAGDNVVLAQVLPVPGVELLYQHDGGWRQLGRRLPVVGPPAGPLQRLEALIVPERLTPLDPPAATHQRVPLTLVRDSQPRPASALVCSLATLHDWAVQATSRQLAALRGARAGERVLLLGEKLPLLPASVRLWGRRMLVPLGCRAEPALPESAWIEALGLGDEAIAILGQASAAAPDQEVAEPQIDIVPADAVQTLSRAAVRLAWAEVRP